MLPVLTIARIPLFGLLPMVYAAGPRSNVQPPPAVVVAGGLIMFTALKLLVMPAWYAWFDRGGRRVRVE